MSVRASRLRSDAQQNRDRIVQVARAVFAERGLDVPMAAIARRAGVGIATLYRRFPAKEALVAEVFADKFDACRSAVYDALADPDPWCGFCRAVSDVCALQAADRGFNAAFLRAYPDTVDVEQERSHALRGFAELVERAKATGRLRADFAPGDLALLLLANRGVVAGPAETAVAASRRLTAYLLTAFRAEHARPLPPPVALDLLAALDARHGDQCGG